MATRICLSAQFVYHSPTHCSAQSLKWKRKNCRISLARSWGFESKSIVEDENLPERMTPELKEALRRDPLRAATLITGKAPAMSLILWFQLVNMQNIWCMWKLFIQKILRKKKEKNNFTIWLNGLDFERLRTWYIFRQKWQFLNFAYIHPIELLIYRLECSHV